MTKFGRITQLGRDEFIGVVPASTLHLHKCVARFVSDGEFVVYTRCGTRSTRRCTSVKVWRTALSPHDISTSCIWQRAPTSPWYCSALSLPCWPSAACTSSVSCSCLERSYSVKVCSIPAIICNCGVLYKATATCGLLTSLHGFRPIALENMISHIKL